MSSRFKWGGRWTKEWIQARNERWVMGICKTMRAHGTITKHSLIRAKGAENNNFLLLKNVPKS